MEIRIDSQSIGMSRLQLFELELRLDAVIAQKPNQPILFDLTDEVCAFAAGVRGGLHGATESGCDEEEEYEEYEPMLAFNRRESDVLCVNKACANDCRYCGHSRRENSAGNDGR
jgi:hypothetical protein